MSGHLDWMHISQTARAVAMVAHLGQVDKAGQPYIDHCQRVAARMTSAAYQAAAWLHDVLEDTELSAADLIEMGCPTDVVQAVKLLTRGEESVEDYYRFVRWNPIALAVKRADIADNTDPRRLLLLDDATQLRLVKKYAKALELVS